jgi:VanZ family protein
LHRTILLAPLLAAPISAAMTRFLQFVFWAALLIAFTLALWPQGMALPGNPTDKLQHMAAFFTLAVLGGLAFPSVSLLRLLVLLALFGGLIELAQMLPGLHRDPDSADLMADILAAAVGVLVVAALRRLLARG